MRVRMIKDLALKAGTFQAGKSYEVEDVIARSWIGFHLAEEDKMIDSAPETKEVESAKIHRGASGHRIGPNVTLEVKQGTSPVPVPPAGVQGVPAKPGLARKIPRGKK